MPTQISGTNGIDQIQDGIVEPVDTQVGALPSMVRVNTANGYGSTNTKINRFTNTVLNQGSDITYADSASDGASFTIETNGVYAISYSNMFTTALVFGLSLNSSQLTTNFDSIDVEDVLVSETTDTGNRTRTASWVGYLSATDVVRAHGTGGAAGTTTNGTQFTIVRVA